MFGTVAWVYATVKDWYLGETIKGAVARYCNMYPRLLKWTDLSRLLKWTDLSRGHGHTYTYTGGGGASQWEFFAMGYFEAGVFRMQS